VTILLTSAITKALEDGAIICDPAPPKIEGGQIDITLGGWWWVFQPPHQTTAIDLRFADPRTYFNGPYYHVDHVILPARGFILAHTEAYIGTAAGTGIIPMLHTRSTFARWGYSMCTANAGQGDEGYATRWTLEITNPHDIDVFLPVGGRIGSISFTRGECSAEPYTTGTRYNTPKADWTPESMLPRRGNW
jgi:deoxycytidine triphosphate deaminase